MDSGSVESEASDSRMMNQTKKLIKKLVLKPKYHESQYSQTFIKRERDICNQIMNQTNIRIDQKTPAYLK